VTSEPLSSPWPAGFTRIPDEEWVEQAPATLALKYDTVQAHGWYRNLDRTVEDLARELSSGDILLDYSGGTGILASRLLEELPERGFGIVIVDSSPKFLRLALEKLGARERVAFRLLRYLKAERRLELVPEVLGRELLRRGIDAIASTNAIHLYYDLDETLRSWHDVLRPGGSVFVQSGNIGVELPPGTWIIDETVEAIQAAAVQLVGSSDAYAAYRPALDDAGRMAAYDDLRRKFFLPVRPLEHYVEALGRAGFRVTDVAQLPVLAHVDEWFEFLSGYHEGVLGWVGGSARLEGAEPADEAIADRLRLLRDATSRAFGGASSFEAIWTYITAERP
jgi:ubiquinone/menaquinone biosynthesis C-methylase UbiE